ESVSEGDSVTLNPDLNETQGFNLIEWRFGGEGSTIARTDGNEISYANDERFRDRLQLNDQTGSLTIKNMKNADSGLYRVTVSSSKQMINKRFIVTVSGDVIMITGQILCFAKFAASAVVVFIHIVSRLLCRVIRYRTISVMEGDDVTLNSGTELNKDKQIKWLFGGISILKAPIAEISGETGEIFTYEGKADGRFRNRLKLDPLTGSLTIKNTSPEHFGFYERQIKECRGVEHTLFMVSIINVIKITNNFKMEEGKNVTLEIDSEKQKDDQILWMFGAEETLIAQIKGENRETHDVADERFRDRLKLEESGSLTISNITTEHTGAYKAQIISPEYVPVKKGDDVTLHTDSKIQKSDQIRWMFGDKNLIAEIKEGTGEMATFDDVLEGRFRGRLKLDQQTGSLTITNFRTEHTGLYKMKINRSAGKSKNKSFDVFARGESLQSVNNYFVIVIEKDLI
uniref:Immunoglobulin domain-containing protein n=1 Tax=Cyprinus carpio TaxID=7962 RepID=A0A8C1KNC3_CYPCA